MLSVRSLVGPVALTQEPHEDLLSQGHTKVSCDERETRLSHGVWSSLPLQVRLRAPPSRRAMAGLRPHLRGAHTRVTRQPPSQNILETSNCKIHSSHSVDTAWGGPGHRSLPITGGAMGLEEPVWS